MFDNTKPNIVILTDHTDPLLMLKLFGASKVAAELRMAGFQVAVINHLHLFTVEEIKNILVQLVSDQTVFVGTSPFFYKNIENVLTDHEFDHEQGGKKYGTKELGSFLPHGIKYNQEIKHLIKGINPNCKFVIGGPDAQDRQYNKDYDYVIVGYGDNSGPNLARHLAYGEPLEKSHRSLYGPVIVDDRLASNYNFNSSLMSYEDHDALLPGETMLTEIARGCIFRCGFCSYPLNGKKKLDHIKLDDILYQEFMDNYEKYGITRYMFSDDTYNDSVDKIKMMHAVSKRLPFQLEYWACLRLDLLGAHPETIDLLYESGLRAMMFGIETLHEKASKIIGKGGSRAKQIATINYIKEKYGNNVMMHGSFIFGLPEEPIESMLDTADRLVSGEIKLDSWAIHAFRLQHKGMSYTSEFDLNPEKYGYEPYDNTLGGNRLIWKNKFTNFYECEKLAQETLKRGAIKLKLNKIAGVTSMFIAGLGFDLQYSANKNVVDFDWHQIDLAKQRRSAEYKELLYKQLNIQP